MGKPVDIKNYSELDARLPTDLSYQARTTIDLSHEKIHQGLHWTACAYQTGASAMNVLITSPSDVHYHLIAEVDVTGPATVTWNRAPGFDATGSTTIVSYGNNEDNTTASSLIIQRGGAYTSSGTMLETWLIGNSSGNSGQPILVGGGSSHGQEWELGYDSIHLLRVVPSASCESVIRCYYYRKE